MAKPLKTRDETDSWPYIKFNKARQRWIVDARTKDGGTRKGFQTKGEAITYRDQQRNTKEKQGVEAFNKKELSRFGWTIPQAVDFALQHLRRHEESPAVDEAIKALIKSKISLGRSERYGKDLAMRLERLADYLENKVIAGVTTHELEDFLLSLKVAPQTRNTFRRDIRTLWSFAEKRGWASAIVAKNTERARTLDAPPGILTPAQGQKLLDASTDPSLRAFHAIGMFAGLRVAEIAALEWSAVDLEGGYINVAAAVSKTRARRLVPILPSLAAILRGIPVRVGKVAPQRRLRQLHEAARRKAGFQPPTKAERASGNPPALLPWPDNAMRHSFVSYRLADTGNAAQTALESGHDQSVLFRHYRELVRPTEAAKWWGIGL